MMLNGIKSIGAKWQKLCKVARKRFYKDKIRYTNDTIRKTSKCYLVHNSNLQSLTSMLVDGSILVDKQLTDVILDLDQVRPSMGQRDRKSGEPSERLQGETDLAHHAVFQIYIFGGK